MLKGRPTWRGKPSTNVINGLTLGLMTHAGKLMGSGVSGTEFTSAVASAKMASFYTKNSATSGESMGFYWKHSVAGIGASGTASILKAYSNVAAATLQGLQGICEFGAAGKVSGLAVGVRSQVIFADDATAAPTGSIFGGQSELYFNGDNSSTTDISGATAHAIHRFLVDGDTTARAKARYLFDIANISTGTSDATKMLNTANITASHGLNVRINGEDYCLLVDKK